MPCIFEIQVDCKENQMAMIDPFEICFNNDLRGMILIERMHLEIL